MSVHDDTLQGLQEALDYVRGNKSKGRSMIVEASGDDINVKFSQLSQDKQNIVRIIIDELLKIPN